MTGLSLHFDMTAHFSSYVILLTVPEALCFGVVRPSVRVHTCYASGILQLACRRLPVQFCVFYFAPAVGGVLSDTAIHPFVHLSVPA